METFIEIIIQIILFCLSIFTRESQKKKKKLSSVSVFAASKNAPGRAPLLGPPLSLGVLPTPAPAINSMSTNHRPLRRREMTRKERAEKVGLFQTLVLFGQVLTWRNFSPLKFSVSNLCPNSSNLMIKIRF